MKRVASAPRPDWPARLEQVGIDYHTNGRPPTDEDDGLWWDESVCWTLSEAEVDTLDDATNELHALCLGAVDHLVRREPEALTGLFGFPPWMAEYIHRSWLRGDPSLMGRMDLAFTGNGTPPKLLEYNADTPTLAIETAVAQWQWLETLFPRADQFNLLHENLLDAFRAIAPRLRGRTLHFMAFRESAEEWAHATYFRDLAGQAGIRTHPVDIPAVRWNGDVFLDETAAPIAFLHKLYPWEWAVTDEFGIHLASDTLGILEPPWKAVLSHKALLPVLWRLHPGHPLLLPAHAGPVPPGLAGTWVEKPMLGREGANVRIVRDGAVVAGTGGTYGGGAFVHQQFAAQPSEDGWTTTIGSWVANGKASGLIFREARGDIVANRARVVPHLFRPAPA